MGYDKDPNELGLIFVNDGKVGTKYEGKQSFGGTVFDIPEGVPVVFIADSYVVKPGRPRAGETVKFFRVLLAPTEGELRA